MTFLSKMTDKFLGRGAAAVTVPTLDGPLLPNQLLEQAQTFANLEEADNLVPAKKGLVASSQNRVLCFPWAGGNPTTLHESDANISAVACANGIMAIAVDGFGIKIQGGKADGTEITSSGNTQFSCPTSLAFLDSTTLLMTLGSQKHNATDWKRDLMEKGSTGSLWKIDLATGAAECIVDNLAWAAGVAPTGSMRVFVSEAWHHRVLSVNLETGRSEIALDHLPAYPARISPALDAGYWLSFYSVRNQLVEFILREDAYRKRMISEIDEIHWMAPTLRSGVSFKEPMQGSQLKNLGVLKPFAVTRSYGLVVYCDKSMLPLKSFHSRTDGTAHGTLAACEHDDDLFVASKGGDRILRLPGVAEA